MEDWSFVRLAMGRPSKNICIVTSAETNVTDAFDLLAASIGFGAAALALV